MYIYSRFVSDTFEVETLIPGGSYILSLYVDYPLGRASFREIISLTSHTRQSVFKLASSSGVAPVFPLHLPYFMSLPGDVNHSNTTANAATTSFIYPVRSLLSGIQRPPTRGTSSGDAQVLEETIGQGNEHGASEVIIGDSEATTGEYTLLFLLKMTRSHLRLDVRGAQERPPQAEQSVLFAGTARSTHKKRKHRTPNFRDFQEEEDPLSPRSFTTNPLPNTMLQTDDMSGVNTLFATGPTGERIEYTVDELQSVEDAEDYNPRRPSQLSEVAVEAFADLTPASTLLPSVDGLLPASVQNTYSQKGIIHLGPVESPSQRSHSMGSSRRGRVRRNSGSQSYSPSGALDAVDRELDVVQLPCTRPDSAASGSGSGSVTGSMKSASGSSEGPHITFRYQHLEDDDGHHLIVGREGKLTKCEDEVRQSTLPTSILLRYVFLSFA